MVDEAVYQVRRRELAKMLREFRLAADTKPSEIELRMDTLAEDIRFQARGLPERFSLRPAQFLEDESEGVLEMSALDLQFVAEAYRVHRLLLDPLLQVVVETDECLVENVGDQIQVNGEGVAAYGQGARYGLSSKRLRDAPHMSFVRLELSGGGRSDSHSHPGDELMFVRKGEIEVSFPGSGLCAKLSAGDFVHFYAEQEHLASNPGHELAEVIVIRLRPTGPRHQLVTELNNTKDAKALANRVMHDYVRYALAPSPLLDTVRDGDDPAAENVEEMVLDRYGLGRFLTQLAAGLYRGLHGRLTLDELTARGQRTSFSRSRIQRVQKGAASVRQSDFSALGAMYDTRPIMFCDFLAGVHPGAIAVRRENRTGPPNDSSEMIEIPARYVDSPGCRYFRSPRRLADSDVTLSEIRLAPGASSPVNRHPGHEVIIPLSGSMEVFFGATRTPISAENTLFAHFASRREHHVANFSTQQPASALVIRVFGD